MDRSSAARILGVRADSRREEVVAAYRRYVRAHHPDSAADHGGQFGAGAALARAARARECLLGVQRPGADSAETVRSDRQRTFHETSPWWRRLIFWRKP